MRYTMRAEKIAIMCVCVAFCTSALLFSGGCNATEDWVRRTIENNYFRFDGDYSSVENLSGLSVDEMMDRLDIYSAYYTREEYARVFADNAGSKSGVGVSYAFEEGKGIVIHSVTGNSPAYKAGLKAGDVLTYGNAGGIKTEFGSADDFSGFIEGRAFGEDFTLGLSGGGTAVLAKADYTASYASMYLSDKYYYFEPDKSDEPKVSEEGIGELPEGVAYIYLSQFFGEAADEMGKLISEYNAEGCHTLILDLRSNGGGYVDVMRGIGGLFTAEITDNAVAMVAKYKRGNEATAYCTSYPEGSTEVFPAGDKLYVMADSSTASASEALIGVLISYGVLDYSDIFLTKFGDSPAKTYGKGIMQSTFINNVTHAALKLTTAGIYWQNGVTIHGRGLTPADGCKEAASTDGIADIGGDEELSAVLSAIAGG